MENAPSISASNNIDFKISLTSIKAYADTLLKFRKEVNSEYFNLYCDRKPDLIKLFDEEGKEEIKEILVKDFENFVLSVSQGNVIEKELSKLSFNNISLPDLPNASTRPLEMSLKFYLIKKTFLKFLPKYSDSLSIGLEIIKELDEITLLIDHYFSNVQLDLNRQNLQRERDFANSLINHSTNGIIAFSKEKIITSWNNVIEKISGIKKDFVLGKKIFDLFPEFIKSEEGQAIEEVLKGETILLHEKEFANGTGHYIASGVPLFGIENEIVGGFIVFQDISNQKKAAKQIEESRAHLEKAYNELQLQVEEYQRSQEQLKNNEKLLKKTQELAHIGTWVWDVRANTILWSEELKKLLGVNGEIKNASIKSYLERVHPEDRKTFLSRIRSAVRSKYPFDYEHRIIFSDESIRYIFGQGVPEMVDGRTIITGFSQDVTLKRKAIETLQSSENRFRTLCEKSPDAIFLLDNEEILYCNQSALSMLGANNKSEVLKIKFPQLSPDQSLHGIKQKIEMVQFNELTRFESQIKKINGNLFWCEVILTPIKLEQKDILHAVVRDISSRKKIEQDVINAQEELKRINNELEARIEERTHDLEITNKNLKRVNADMDNFIYTASHDLKAPILNIEGLIKELTQLDCYHLHDDIQLLLDMMSICVNKFKKTIEDLSDVTKNIKADVLDEKPIEIREIVEDIEISIQNLITSSSASIKTDFSGFNTIRFSRKNLRSVLYNLINNAIKYSVPDRPPVILISTYKEGMYDVLAVKDNGLGLSVSNKDKVFSIFKRIHFHVEGSGVGLYLVKRIMENSGGKVELESEEGVGSTFKLYFRNQ